MCQMDNRSGDGLSAKRPQESVRVILRCEGNEMLADARPQARKNRKRIRWNTLRIFSGRERPRCLQMFAAVEWHYSDRLLESSSSGGRLCEPPPFFAL